MLHNGEDSTQKFLFLLTSSTFLKNNLCYSPQAVFYNLNLNNQITYFIRDVGGHRVPKLMDNSHSNPLSTIMR